VSELGIGEDYEEGEKEYKVSGSMLKSEEKGIHFIGRPLVLANKDFCGLSQKVNIIASIITLY
jgi:hypothetical protein